MIQAKALSPQKTHCIVLAMCCALIIRDRQGCGGAAAPEHKLPPCTQQETLMRSNKAEYGVLELLSDLNSDTGITLQAGRLGSASGDFPFFCFTDLHVAKGMCALCLSCPCA